jgi:hypothetical protein
MAGQNRNAEARSEQRTSRRKIVDGGSWIVDVESKKKLDLHRGWDFQSQSVLGTFCSKFCMLEPFNLSGK